MRPWYAIGLVICISAMLIAYFYMEKYLGLPPCHFCMLDRALIVLSGIVFLIGWLHGKPGRLARGIYGLLLSIFTCAGVAVGLRHVILQNQPKSLFGSNCGASLDYMLENLPVLSVLGEILKGSGDCADIQKEFWGFSIPELTLALFAILALYSLYLFFSSFFSQSSVA